MTTFLLGVAVGAGLTFGLPYLLYRWMNPRGGATR
jgi:hypothetical protein